jgi:hypothetical protein
MGSSTDRITEGMTFGFGTVVDSSILLPRIKDGRPDGNKRAAMLRCHPDCNALYVVPWSDLRRGSGGVKSCGCRGVSQAEFETRRNLKAVARAAGYVITTLRLEQLEP